MALGELQGAHYLLAGDEGKLRLDKNQEMLGIFFMKMNPGGN